MNKWKFPLHFIDFETSTVALPFTKGEPYEQVAFQFSHHIYYENGNPSEHETNLSMVYLESFQILNLSSIETSFVEDDGTIFRCYSRKF